MKTFMNQDFLLTNETARTLYHSYAEQMPVFDYHNHLSAREIYDDIRFSNITRAWLYGDHYKWRAMRTAGFPEELITGPCGELSPSESEEQDYRRFCAWAETIEGAIGNPLYHWTHLELQRYFDITLPLSPGTCKEIWDSCNSRLSSPDFSVRNLLKKHNVKSLCTTNDPCEDLHYHRLLKKEGFSVEVLPTFRPDKAYLIGKEDYPRYLDALAKTWGHPIGCLSDLKEALTSRLDFFIREAGCLLSDHSLEGCIYAPAADEQAQAIFEKRMSGSCLSLEERRCFQGNVLTFLGKQYAARGIAMQLHIGALRNNAGRMLQCLGPDTGFDSIRPPELHGLYRGITQNNPLLPEPARLRNARRHVRQFPVRTLPRESPVRDSLVVLRQQTRHGSPAGGSFLPEPPAGKHRHAHRLQKLPLLPKARILPENPLQ